MEDPIALGEAMSWLNALRRRRRPQRVDQNAGCRGWPTPSTRSAAGARSPDGVCLTTDFWRAALHATGLAARIDELPAEARLDTEARRVRLAEMRRLVLSHAAILAREYGLPAVVNVKDVTRHLHDGDRVELNGTTARLRLLGRHAGGGEAPAGDHV
jgi:phosphoenolpyruvate synthase/pyruvate phosphate dikinase